MIDLRGIYGVWRDRELVALGPPHVIEDAFPELTEDVIEARLDMGPIDGLRVKMLTPSVGVRKPNKWRDIAAWCLREHNGFDYDEIAHTLNITKETAAAGVSRVRCGRYAEWPKEM